MPYRQFEGRGSGELTKGEHRKQPPHEGASTPALPYPFSPPPRFDRSYRSSPPLRSILENKGGGRQGECLSALQRLIKSSDERQRVNWQSRQDLADEKVAAVKREEQKEARSAAMHALGAERALQRQPVLQGRRGQLARRHSQGNCVHKASARNQDA